jgi:hypothetical protein
MFTKIRDWFRGYPEDPVPTTTSGVRNDLHVLIDHEHALIQIQAYIGQDDCEVPRIVTSISINEDQILDVAELLFQANAELFNARLDAQMTEAYL